jgi:hypothetical protein
MSADDVAATTTIEKSYENSCEEDSSCKENEDKSWRAIVETVRSRNRKRINAVVFRHISQTENKPTGEAICALEQRLRDEEIDLWCVAHPISPPDQLARTLDGEPCNYFLMLALTQQDRDAVLADEKYASIFTGGTTERAIKNDALLRETGFQTAATSSEKAKTAGKKVADAKEKADYLELPSDLCGEHDSHFDDAAIRFYDPTLSAALFARHAKEVVKDRGKKNKVLSNTGVQVVRTSVPLAQWSETRAAIVEQARLLQPIADMAIVGAVREQVIPLGFQLHGTTKTPIYLGKQSEPVALFDLYCCTVRRYHLQVSQADADFFEKHCENADEKEEELLRNVVAEYANTVPEELSEITFARLQRYVQYTIDPDKQISIAASQLSV